MLGKLKSGLKNLFTFKGGLDTVIKVCIIVILAILIFKILSPIISLTIYILEVLLGLVLICLIIALCTYLYKKFNKKK